MIVAISQTAAKVRFFWVIFAMYGKNPIFATYIYNI